MYKLLLIGCFTPWRTYTSCEFFSKELSDRFSKLPHVQFFTQHFTETTCPEVDVVLVHSYTGFPPVANIPHFKKNAKKVVYFMEQGIEAPGFDHYYYYDRYFKTKNKAPGTFIKIPLVKKYYGDSFLPKEPGSILLDHDYQQFRDYKHPGWDWNERLWDFFLKHQDRYGQIYQLERGDVVRPSFIKTIPMKDAQEYLDSTAKFETFISTHAGSYNHTLVDMAVRGSRIIVPWSPLTHQKYIVPECLISDLDMTVIRDVDELTTALNVKSVCESKLDRATDLDEVVTLMDRDFKSWTKRIILS